MGAKTVDVVRSGCILPANHATENALLVYCPDLADWPRSWMGEERDVVPGEALVACFKPFLFYLLSLNLSKKTLRRHRDNLWILGGEVIRDLQMTPKLRKRPIEALVFSVIGDDGGPLMYHGDSEEEQRSFDSTCRKLYRFLNDPKNNPPTIPR